VPLSKKERKAARKAANGGNPQDPSQPGGDKSLTHDANGVPLTKKARKAALKAAREAAAGGDGKTGPQGAQGEDKSLTHDANSKPLSKSGRKAARKAAREAAAGGKDGKGSTDPKGGSPPGAKDPIVGPDGKPLSKKDRKKARKEAEKAAAAGTGAEGSASSPDGKPGDQGTPGAPVVGPDGKPLPKEAQDKAKKDAEKVAAAGGGDKKSPDAAGASPPGATVNAGKQPDPKNNKPDNQPQAKKRKIRQTQRPKATNLSVVLMLLEYRRRVRVRSPNL
jgi:hypothetical protein